MQESEELKRQFRQLGYRCLLLLKVKYMQEGERVKAKLVDEELLRRRNDTADFLGRAEG